jgi:O-antigen/teichoic acid export membrane protein
MREAASMGHLVRGVVNVLLSSGLAAGLGFSFWILAARLLPAREVGQASALTAAMNDLSVLCQLNLGNAIVRFLPSARRDPGRLLLAAYGASMLMTFVFATGFVVLVPHVAHNFRFLEQGWILRVGFVAAVSIWGVSVLQDSALVAFRRTAWIPFESAAYGILKIACLLLLIAIGVGHSAWVAAVLPAAALTIPVNWLIFRRIVPHWQATRAERPTPPPFDRERVRRFLVRDLSGTLVAQIAYPLLPLLALGLLGSREAAYFAIPFFAVNGLEAILILATTPLVVEGALTPANLARLTRRMLWLFMVVTVPGVVVLVLAAPLVLASFGADYADHGVVTLRLLALACLPRALIFLAVAVFRVEGDGRRIQATFLATLVIGVGSAVPLAQHYGIAGIASGWLAGSTAVGIAVIPRLLRAVRASPRT